MSMGVFSDKTVACIESPKLGTPNSFANFEIPEFPFAAREAIFKATLIGICGS
jgi:hypothetical protein